MITEIFTWQRVDTVRKEAEQLGAKLTMGADEWRVALPILEHPGKFEQVASGTDFTGLEMFLHGLAVGLNRNNGDGRASTGQPQQRTHGSTPDRLPGD